MALLTCPECGHNVSDQAEICPGCGYPVSKILAAAQPTPEQAAPAQKIPEQNTQPEVRQPAVQIGAPSQPDSYLLSAIRGLVAIAALLLMFARMFPETSSKIIEDILNAVPASQASKPAAEPKLPDSIQSKLEKTLKEDSEAEQKRKAQARAEINELRQYFRSEIDKVENIKWISHKKTPRFIQNKTIYTYLGDVNGKVWPRVVIGFQKTDWIFMKQIIINVDGATYNIDVNSLERKTDIVGDGTIIEYVDLRATPELEKIMWAAAHGKKSVVRFQGEQYHYDFEVNSQQKQALKHIWGYYRAKRVLGEIL